MRYSLKGQDEICSFQAKHESDIFKKTSELGEFHLIRTIM